MGGKFVPTPKLVKYHPYADSHHTLNKYHMLMSM